GWCQDGTWGSAITVAVPRPLSSFETGQRACAEAASCWDWSASAPEKDTKAVGVNAKPEPFGSSCRATSRRTVTSRPGATMRGLPDRQVAHASASSSSGFVACSDRPGVAAGASAPAVPAAAVGAAGGDPGDCTVTRHPLSVRLSPSGPVRLTAVAVYSTGVCSVIDVPSDALSRDDAGPWSGVRKLILRPPPRRTGP